MPYQGGPRGPKKPERNFSKAGGASGGPRKSYGDKPAFGERKPYGPRKDFGDKPAFGERKPYGPRKDFGDKPAFGERKPYGPRKHFGDKPAFGERKPYGPRKDFGDKPAFGERKPYGPRKDFGDRPYTPRPPRDHDGEAPQRAWGDAKKPRFAENTPRKAQFERKPRDTDAAILANGDGWLVGHHAVLAALQNGRRKVREVWLLSEATGPLAQVLGAHPEWPVQIKAREDFSKQFGDAVHQGVAALVGNLHQPSLPELLATKPTLLVALDQVTDPHNLGAIVRSAAAFGAQGVLVTEHRAAGVNATAAKAAAGALETVPVAEITNLANGLKMLKEQGFVCIGMAGEAETDLAEAIAAVPANTPVCLVVGSEGEGLRRLTRESCDHLARINISSAVESLNVSVATGVALAFIAKRA